MAKQVICKRALIIILLLSCIGCAYVLPVRCYIQRDVLALNLAEAVVTDAADFKRAVAEAAGGDTITVAGEITLSESIVLNKKLTIKKSETAEKAVFLLAAEPLNTGRHFIIGDDTEAAFINIGFKGHGSLGYTEEGSVPPGGGIEARMRSKLTLTGCMFLGNINRFGGAVGMQESGFISADKCSFSYNRATYKGGAIYTCGLYPDSGEEDSIDEGINSGSENREYLSRLTITDSTIENNWAEYCGGGIQLDDFSEGEVRNCVINNNRITKKGNIYLDGGGGIAVGAARIFVYGSVFSNNEAQNGGGLHFDYMGYSERMPSVIAECVITKNTAYGNGGGIFAYNKSAILLYGCSIYENVSERGGGACIGEKGDSIYGNETNAGFIFCTVALNRSSLEGGGIIAKESVTAVYGTLIAGNSSAGEALPKTFTIGADSLYSEGYAELINEKPSNNGHLKIKPGSPAHNKIPQAEAVARLKNDTLAPLSEISSNRIMYGGAYDIGAYELPEYHILFMAGDSIYSESDCCEGEAVLLPDKPVKKGYVFMGWYCDPDFETEYNVMPASGDLVLYARFEREAGLTGLAIFFIIAGSVLIIAAALTCAFLHVYKKRVLKLTANINIPEAPQLCNIYPELGLLTSRESEVFKFLLAGNTLRQIAGELKIGYTTVNFHYKNIYKKLRVNSRIELIKKYGKLG